ncbi:MAG: FAD-dependent oxidoreductase [Chitinispirillaceae bacterium]|nr:FAD-dependent oxidoreductase [Chitinispirillaceae bacterium]
MSPRTAAVIGAGLAGCEAALVLARHGVAVDLYEMRPAFGCGEKIFSGRRLGPCS